ncbi:MAG: RNA polymerase sporulation sigma factor SigH [Agathobacter sp.]|nr:RNA polymerase sporulation sigma factor SigH [Agathobacter sp.]
MKLCVRDLESRILMNYKDFTDEELIEKLRAGDAEITDYIMEKYKPLVRKKTNAMYLIGGDTEDLIQEGMIGLFKAVRDFNPEKEVSFFSFAEMCISRQLYSALEASNRKKHIPLNTYISFSNQDEADGINLEQMITEQTISPEQMLIEQEGKKEFFDKLEEKLSPMERKVLYLYLEGSSYTQIAEQMGKSAKSIDNTLQRIRGKIKVLKDDM